MGTFTYLREFEHYGQIITEYAFTLPMRTNEPACTLAMLLINSMMPPSFPRQRHQIVQASHRESMLHIHNGPNSRKPGTQCTRDQLSRSEERTRCNHRYTDTLALRLAHPVHELPRHV